jgi:hypothetical protein
MKKHPSETPGATRKFQRHSVTQTPQKSKCDLLNRKQGAEALQDSASKRILNVFGLHGMASYASCIRAMRRASQHVYIHGRGGRGVKCFTSLHSFLPFWYLKFATSGFIIGSYRRSRINRASFHDLRWNFLSLY